MEKERKAVAMSVDLGVKNLAFSLFDEDGELVDFDLINTGIGQKTAVERCKWVKNFVSEYPDCKKLVIEKQLPVNVVCFALMYTFVSVFLCREGGEVVVTPPWVKFGKLGMKMDTQKKAHKKETAEKVLEYLNDEQKEKFRRFWKKDDIADCILQFIALRPMKEKEKDKEKNNPMKEKEKEKDKEKENEKEPELEPSHTDGIKFFFTHRESTQ
jgi:hypothetical protein